MFLPIVNRSGRAGGGLSLLSGADPDFGTPASTLAAEESSIR
jgi:hypothetical protein